MRDSVTIFENLSDAEADLYSLILSSAGIIFSSEYNGRGWNIEVAHSDKKRAQDLIDEYFAENEAIPPETYPYVPGTLYSALAAACVLIFFYAALGTDPSTIKLYGASAERILSGELYRTVTSLMLHLDAVHLLGNLIGILVFGTATCSIAGTGVGWLMILVAGIAGNFAGALLYQSGHLSAGASTSVFGALGIITAHQFQKKTNQGRGLLERLIPVAGGLALLGLFGSARGSDLAAHFFGYASGIILGTLHGWLFGRPLDKQMQIFSTAMCAGIVITAWFVAF